MIARLRHWAGANRGRAIAAAAGLVCLLVLVYRFAFRAEPTRASPERAVSVAADVARTGDMPVYLDGIGTVTPRAMVTVRPRVDGHLMTIHFVEGQTVA